MTRIVIITLTIAFCLSIGIADAQNISDEAMHHFDRGQAAVEMAKSPTDYEDAIKEFEKAATLAPDWPDVYYNLGLIQEKLSKYGDAIKNLTKYLELSPNASDSREVKKFVAKMEYKKEKAETQTLLDFQLYWAALGVDTTMTDEHDGTTRRLAGNTRTVKDLLAKGADPNAKNDLGVTALKAAKNTETVRVLLVHGADVNAKGPDGDTTLMYRENAETVKVLLANGADVNAKDNHGLTALKGAETLGSAEVIRLLKQAGARK